MAYSRDDLALVEAAISSGTTSVQYKDRRVQYQSLAELRRLRREMLAEIERDEGVRRKPRGRWFRAYQSGQGY